MRYRKIDENKDMVFGRGLSSFWQDVPDAPAQAVDTRLRLNYGEWYLAPTDGTPWNTRVLGRYTESTRDPTVRGRIAGTRGVNNILQYSSDLNRDTRDYNVSVQIDTIYGNTALRVLLEGEPV
jgi:hypothetical protein